MNRLKKCNFKWTIWYTHKHAAYTQTSKFYNIIIFVCMKCISSTYKVSSYIHYSQKIVSLSKRDYSHTNLLHLYLFVARSKSVLTDFIFSCVLRDGLKPVWLSKKISASSIVIVGRKRLLPIGACNNGRVGRCRVVVPEVASAVLFIKHLTWDNSRVPEQFGYLKQLLWGCALYYRQ